jgi:hypothetical protein
VVPCVWTAANRSPSGISKGLGTAKGNHTVATMMMPKEFADMFRWIAKRASKRTLPRCGKNIRSY